MTNSLHNIEIMSPVGSFESLQAAIQGGAGSVYFGVGHLNMRARSSLNFTFGDLKEITGICRNHGIKTYITLNTVIYDEETEEMKKVVDTALENGVDAVIASDMAVITYARKAGMNVHMSTQTNITNIEAVKHWAQYAEVMVMARELNLQQVAAITKAIRQEKITAPSGNPVRIEMFVHGALCMAVSGKCYLSLDNYNHSGNRGACYQLCRRGYRVFDKEGEFELEIDNEYIMSPKDLKTIDFLDKMLQAGVTVLKIEGRGRSPEYVKTVTRVYKEAVGEIFSGCFNQTNLRIWNDKLAKVYHRGFWDGYYLGQKMGEWSDRYGSHATQTKSYIGKVTNYFGRIEVAEITLEAGDLKKGDSLLIIGKTTGVLEQQVNEIRLELSPVPYAGKGQVCSIPVNSEVRRGDKVYTVIKRNEVENE